MKELLESGLNLYAKSRLSNGEYARINNHWYSSHKYFKEGRWVKSSGKWSGQEEQNNPLYFFTTYEYIMRPATDMDLAEIMLTVLTT